MIDNKRNVCILGMGYVGLTMGLVLADKGFIVTGVDIDESKIKAINNYQPKMHEIGLLSLLKKQLKKNFNVQTTLPNSFQDVFVIAVGTPIDLNSKKIMDNYIVNATNQLVDVLKDSALVILRSTVTAGTTRNVVKKILDKSKKNYYLAFCPERTVQGKAIEELKNLPQIVGGIDEESTKRASDFFKSITNNIVEVSSVEIAEIIKKINNSYRDMTFAFANEIAKLCENIDLDAFEVIAKSNEKYDRSNIPLPGFVGGYCLTKDPYILLQFAKENKVNMSMLKHGREVNEELPIRSAERICTKLKECGKDLNTAKVFLTGFAFKGKPETDDMRNTPTLVLANALKEIGLRNIYAHDFIVNQNELEQKGFQVASIDKGFKDADCVIIANNHEKYFKIDIDELLSSAKAPVVFFDAWNIFGENPVRKKEGVHYMGIGVNK